jgi:hypothetical protein
VLRRPGTRACPGRLGLGKYTAARRRAGPSSESQCSRVAFSGRPSALAGNLLCFRRCFSCFASRFLCTGAQGQTCARLTEDTLSARSTLPRRRTRANSRPDAVVIVEGKGPRLLLLRIRIWVPHFRRGRVAQNPEIDAPRRSKVWANETGRQISLLLNSAAACFPG